MNGIAQKPTAALRFTTARRILFGVLALFLLTLAVAPAFAQDKPAMYTYVANWTLPRAQWGEFPKAVAEDSKVLAKAAADGLLVGFGDDRALVHQNDESTHDIWFSSTSLASLLDALAALNKSADAPVLLAATHHSDEIFVSHFYNWKPGTYRDAYTFGSVYKFKADAPHDALETLAKNVMVPIMEKLLADGDIVEYDIDTEAVHTSAPDKFFIFYIAPKSEGVAKARAAIQEAGKSNQLLGPAFGSFTDSTGHRDYLARTNAMWK